MVRTLVQRVIAFVLRLRLMRAYLRYAEHKGSMLADSITYRALFSVFAGVLLGFSVAATWLAGNPDALEALTEALDAAIPGFTDVVDPRKHTMSVGFSIVGIASLLGLVSAAISAIGSLRQALLTLSDQLHDDGFVVWVMLRNLLVALGFGGLLVLAAVMSVLGSLGLETVLGWFGGAVDSRVTAWLTRLVGIVVVLIIDTCAIALVFRLLSGVAAPRSALWAGSLLGGIGLTVLQELSGLFVRGASSNPLLGTFAALIALLLWFNLSAQVILIASTYIIVATDEAHDRLREKYGAATLAQLRRRRAEDQLRAATQALRAAQEAERVEREKSAP